MTRHALNTIASSKKSSPPLCRPTLTKLLASVGSITMIASSRCGDRLLPLNSLFSSLNGCQRVSRQVIKAVVDQPRLSTADCPYVLMQGCDASLLLTGTASEQKYGPNQTLKKEALQLVNEIKSELEQACPNTVSCADILSLAAADSLRQVCTLGMH